MESKSGDMQQLDPSGQHRPDRHVTRTPQACRAVKSRSTLLFSWLTAAGRGKEALVAKLVRVESRVMVANTGKESVSGGKKPGGGLRKVVGGEKPSVLKLGLF